MKEHKIKPHKGGRTERVYARLTEAEKAQLQRILKREQLSLSDWIVRKLQEDTKRS